MLEQKKKLFGAGVGAGAKSHTSSTGGLTPVNQAD